MAPLPLTAPGAGKSFSSILSSLSKFLFPKPKPEVPDGNNDQWKVPVLFGLGIPKPERGEDMPKATVMFPPESRQTETDSIWKATGLGNTDEYAELSSNPWNDYRKRSLQAQESPAMTLTAPGVGASMEQELGKCPLTMSQEILLLIFAWFAAMVLFGAVVWVMAKMEKKIRRFVDRGITGFGEKKGARRALHCVGYGSVIIATISTLLLLIAVMFALKGLLGRAILFRVPKGPILQLIISKASGKWSAC
ncbi:hypothetical protein HOY82DRAFT_597050 [Tuber indicum]|nr:hypothetical protein HOY82DRAFT_597050 [Tuber indicum]